MSTVWSFLHVSGLNHRHFNFRKANKAIVLNIDIEVALGPERNQRPLLKTWLRFSRQMRLALTGNALGRKDRNSGGGSSVAQMLLLRKNTLITGHVPGTMLETESELALTVGMIVPKFTTFIWEIF